MDKPKNHTQHYKIEKRIPIKNKCESTVKLLVKTTASLKMLEVGDSFVVPFENQDDYIKTRQRISSLVGAEQRRHNKERMFTTRKLEKGIRIWRIK